MTPADQQLSDWHDLEERISIYIFDAGLSEYEAIRLAKEDIENRKIKQERLC